MIAPFTFIRPCAPALKRIPPDCPDWVHEIKFDGWRLQAHKNGGETTLFSRSGRDITASFPAVAGALRALPRQSLILDGELISTDEKGRPDFHSLRKRRPNASGIIFDILLENGTDLRRLPWSDRRKRLEKLMARNRSPILVLSEVWEDGTALLKAAAEQRIEGIVSKYRNAPYRSGPTDAWQKVKIPGWESFRK